MFTRLLDFCDHKFTTKIEASVIMTNGESVKDMTSKFDKLVKFEGQDFHRWQKKMHFLLTTLKVVYVLSTPSPVWSDNETLETNRKRMKWENDYICSRHILNGMFDSLFDIYQNAESAKALWESLESKYMAEDASAMKIVALVRAMMALVQMCLRILKSNKDDEVAWWVDSGATSHVCKDLQPNDYVSVNSIIESRDAIFDEERFTSIPRPRGMIQPSSGKIAEDEVEVQSEIDSIMHNDTWELTDLPPGCKALGCFRQKEGIDFFDTYAPVARISTIRLLLALAAIHDLVIHQVDVKAAFLNGDLDEEIYMKQPEGKFDASGKGVIICLYVDDMLIFGTDQDQVNKTKEFLSSKFDMKDLGEAEVILGIRIKRGNNGISVSQSHYIEKN
nr:hypothetical protein [Tanacetum cinerariifolium]